MSILPPERSTELVALATDRGALSPATAAALQQADVNRQVQQLLDSSYALTRRRDMLYVTLMPDDSESIFTIRRHVYAETDNSASITRGHNELLQAMLDGREANHVMLQTRYLNGTVLNPFSPLQLCQQMTPENYLALPNETPLFTQTFITLASAVAKCEEAFALGGTASSATLIMSDGAATDETQTSRLNLVRLIEDMSRTGNHVITAMGIGRRVKEYVETFRRMGIEERLIFHARDREAILEAFRLFRSKMLELVAGRRSSATVTPRHGSTLSPR